MKKIRPLLEIFSTQRGGRLNSRQDCARGLKCGVDHLSKGAVNHVGCDDSDEDGTAQ
jgi:hypothetical protein